MSDEPVKLPREVDDPPLMLMWSADELITFFICFFIGFLLERVLIFVVIGYFVVKVVRRYRNSRPDGYIIHLMYWIGVPLGKSRTLPNPYETEFRG